MYYNEKTTLFLDGQWLKAKDAKTDLYTQSLHYGAGVFEGIRAYKTETGTLVFKAKQHYERLHYSAEKMHIKLPYSVEELTQLTYELLEKNDLQDAYIRPLVYLGANMALQPTEETHLMLCAWNWGRYLGDKALNVMISSFERPNPKSCFVEAKVTGHYTNSILATTEAKAKGYDEALLLDRNGNVAEGSGANFFYQNNGKLYTSPLGNILAGITRQTVLELAEDLGFEVLEKFFTPQDVYHAEGAFFTGTAAEVAQIGSLDGHKFSLKWEETIGFELAEAYQAKVRNKRYKHFNLV